MSNEEDALFDGLDDLPWSELEHAYGPATDVPELLRALGDGDDEALQALYGNIHHQGSVYSATSRAVPFLIRLTKARGGVPKDAILSFLAAIAERGADFSSPNADELAALRAVQDGVATYLRIAAGGITDERIAAGYVLSRCGQDSRAHDGLSSLLRTEKDEAARASFVRALTVLDGDGTLEALSQRMRADPAPVVRMASALGVLLLADDPPEAAFRVLVETAPDAREEFAATPWCDGDFIDQLCRDLGEDEETCLRLVEHLLRSTDPQTRAEAVWAAGEQTHTWRAASAVFVPLLVDILRSSEDEAERQRVASALAESGMAVRSVADAVYQELEREPTASIQKHLLEALARVADPRVAGVAAARLRDGRWADIPEPVWQELGPAFEPALPDLFSTLLELRGNHWPWAMEAIGGCGARAKGVVPTLITVLASAPPTTLLGNDPMSRMLMARAVPHSPLSVAIALGRIGPDAREAVPALTRYLSDANPNMKINTAVALWRIEPVIDRSLPPLLDLLSATKDAPRERNTLGCVCGAISELGPAAAPAADRLSMLLSSDDQWTRLRAAKALWHVRREPGPVLDTMTTALRAYPSVEVVRCLGEMGPAARAAVPALENIVASRRRLLGGIASEIALRDDQLQAAAATALRAVT